MNPRSQFVVSPDSASASPRVHCDGLVATDLVAVVDFPVPRDEKVRLDTFVRQGGGPAANASVAIARLGGRASFSGAVGDDAVGAEQVAELRDEGVDVTGMVAVAGAPSFLCMILVDTSDGARTIYSAPDRAPQRGASEAPALDPDVALLLVDGWGGDAQLEVARRAEAAGVPALLDAGSDRPPVRALLPHVPVVIGSTPFAASLAGSNDPADGVRALLAAGARLAAVTHGATGVTAGAAGTDEIFEIPAFRVPVVDTTGAGDAFHAGAAFALASGRSWADSLRWGAAVAALKCRQAGARGGLPTAAEAAALAPG